MGLFMELGPCSIVSNPSSDGSLGPNLTTKHNPYSWNENANLFFLDQVIRRQLHYLSTSDADSFCLLRLSAHRR